jgi:hypothetical protein
MQDSYGHKDQYHFYIEICGDEQTGEYLPTARETFKHTALFEELGNRRFKVTEPVFIPAVGTKMVFAPRPRHGTCFFAENSCAKRGIEVLFDNSFEFCRKKTSSFKSSN